ncbi:hypothetical protein Sjap_014502 [Stephania japonica]|uniref:Uncharacterized protein n=1 Tax=Stephania japonica TaxID=461633 RepID=A0AAP0NRY8_9MAGN
MRLGIRKQMVERRINELESAKSEFKEQTSYVKERTNPEKEIASNNRFQILSGIWLDDEFQDAGGINDLSPSYVTGETNYRNPFEDIQIFPSKVPFNQGSHRKESATIFTIMHNAAKMFFASIIIRLVLGATPVACILGVLSVYASQGTIAASHALSKQTNRLNVSKERKTEITNVYQYNSWEPSKRSSSR